MGPGCFVAKVDVANAFRNLATHPSAHRYGFLVIEGKVYLDGAINFGCRASPKVFDSVAAAINWVVQHRCDDLLGVGMIEVMHSA